MRLEWRTSISLAPRISGSAFVSSEGHPLPRLARELTRRRAVWRSEIVLGQSFFDETTQSAVPVDLRAIRHLRSSPLAIDLYVWLTYRMSYLKKPTVIPWESLQAQFGADYGRPRDFGRRAMGHLKAVVRVYPTLRVGQTDAGLRIYPSPPHILRSKSTHSSTALECQRPVSTTQGFG